MKARTQLVGWLHATSLAALSAGLIHAPASAQSTSSVDVTASTAQTEDGPDERSETASDIIVTGTRVARDGYRAPTPTTVVTADSFQQAAQPTVVDFVNTLPALSGSATPRNTGPTVGGGIGGANFLNLRNLGVNRTLVLLDGRRVVSAATLGAVDINTLPTGLLSRVDIVTGGASAAWGSDAVAGVVNFVLDTRYSGVKGEVSSGISEYGDARTFRATLSAGTGFADGRGHFLVSAEYVNNGSVDRANSRPWFEGYKIVNNPAFVAGNGQPRLVLAPNVGLSNATFGGLITTGILRGTQFLPGGTPAPFDFGQLAGAYKLDGSPSDIAGNTQLLAPLEYGTIFARASFDLSDSLSFFAEGSYGKSITSYISVPYFRLGNLNISQDNAFLDAGLRTRLLASGATSFTMGRINQDFGNSNAYNRREVYRGVVGASGSLGGGWTWDAYYQHGQSDVLNLARNNPVVARYNLAADAVRNPAGQIVCRSTLTNPTNGCVPVNLFGDGSVSPAAINYITGTASQAIRLNQDVAAATLRGEPFSLPAGAVSLAAGVEYRREAFTADADPISIANGFWLGNYKPASGSYDVKEAFLELVAPIVKSDGFLRSLELNGAARITDYSTSGSVVTWKVGSTAEILDSVRLRGTISRDIRAPNLNDLFLGGTVTQASIVDTNGANYVILRRQTGNANLRVEEAMTYSGGIVLEPSFVPGLSFSVDYFKINIKDAIASLTIQQISDGCASGTTVLCQYITRGATGLITEITATALNLAEEKTSGVDIEASFRRSLADLGIASSPGAITLRALATYVNDRVIELPGLRIDYAGEVSDFSLPKWRGIASLNYDDDSMSLTLTGRYIGRAVFSNTFVEGITIANNRVPSVVYFDANATFKVPTSDRNGFEFFVSAQNLFNTAPRIAPTITIQQQANYGTNPTVYDTLGRQFLAGMRFRM